VPSSKTVAAKCSKRVATRNVSICLALPDLEGEVAFGRVRIDG
jgi:hypothetical protein